MRTLITILLILFCLQSSAQSAEAGNDQTIYLSQTNTVALGGSSNGASFFWREISTDFSSGGNIVTPTGVTTNVTNLVKQGTFYFELAATTGGTTRRDTVVVRVEYDTPPAGSTLVRFFDMSDPKNYHVVNNRGDTTSYFPLSNRQYSQTEDEKWWLFRGRSNGLMIDSLRGKLRSMNEDGYAGLKACDACPFYPRSEIQLSSYDFLVDTANTYVYEWKGYLPQSENYLNKDGHPNWASILTMFQVHGGAYDYAITNFSMNYNGNISFSNTVVDNSKTGTGDFNPRDSMTIAFIPDFYNKTHTLRVTMREGKGYPGQDAFIKLEMDGVTKYFRNTGGVGSPSFDDYVKFGGLYDWNSWITSKDSLARGRKYSLITESFRIYSVPDVVVPPPTASAGSDQVIDTTETTLTGTATPAAGQTITSTVWSKVSGANVGILNAGSLTAQVSGMVPGEYTFKFEVNQSDGQKVVDQVKVTVNINQPPVVEAIPNQTIKLPGNYKFINQ